MKKNFTKNYTISLIRIITTSMIVVTHMLQSQDNEMAWWLNVGVQIFLIMSGFLYGQKSIENGISWFLKKIKRLLLDYYVFIIIIFLIYVTTNIYSFNSLRIFVNILGLQGFVSGIPGVGHLWYISYIIFCYIITPLLQKIFDGLNKEKEFYYWAILFLMILILQGLDILNIINITVPWIACYVAGYAISRRYVNSQDETDIFSLKSITIIIIPISIILNGFKVYFTYISNVEISNRVLSALINLLFQYSHVFLGLTLFFSMYILFNKYSDKIYKSSIFTNLLDISDKYSFDVYIVHQIFILGQLSLMGLTSYIGLDIIIIIILILMSAYLLRKLSLYVDVFLEKHLSFYS